MRLAKYFYYLSSIARLIFGFRSPLHIVRIFAGTAGAGPYRVVLRESGLSFLVRTRMDVWTVKETHLDRFYERYGFSVERVWNVVDIGGGIGDFTILAAKAGARQVLAFEPTADSLELLLMNLSANSVKNADAYGEAVWSDASGIVLDTSAGEAVRFSSRGAAAPDARPIPSIRLADALDRLPGEHCDLLKVDAEGAEYPIFYASDSATFRRIDRIVMETHERTNPGHNAQSLALYLRQQGYSVETFPNPVHSYLGFLRAWRTAVF